MAWRDLPSCERNVNVGSRTTYRVGGAATYVVTLRDDTDLAALAEAYRQEPRPVYVLGKGSNTLFADAGFNGVVVTLGESFADIDCTDDADGVLVTVGGALALPVVARRLVEQGVTGFEWAVGVPGSVGGAIAMNAGGHGSDMAASVCRARIFSITTGSLRDWDASDLSFGYRHSALRPTDLVLDATLRLHRGDPQRGREELSTIVKWRREHQPGGANAGSVFINPPQDSAGRLIESVGLKGFRVGSAMVSEKHANFIQADDAGRADDVARLMDEVRSIVATRCGVSLRSEIRLVGFGEQS